MTVISIGEIAPRSTWALKHLAFVEEGAILLENHLSNLSDRQFQVEHCQLLKVLQQTATPAGRYLLETYNREASGRGLPKLHLPANDDGGPHDAA